MGKKTSKSTGIIFAFDYGIKKSGLAIGNLSSGLITPQKELLVMKDGIPNWSHIDSLIEEWQPERFLVGNPSIDMEKSSYQQLFTRIKKFKNRVFGRYGKPCDFVDERLTSFEAEQIHCDQAHAWYKIPVDCISAALILQQWLYEHEK